MKKLFMLFLLCEFMFAGVGKFVLVKGDVELVRDGKAIKARSGMEIENKDKIVTLGVAKAQIKFEDNTTVSLGKNTDFVINDYLYAKNNSKIDMGVEKGSFKVISGDVGKLARNNFKFKANSAVIGIRGTIFAGDVGNKNKKDIIACVQGGITVKMNGVARDVNAGKMVEVVGTKISKPKTIDAKQIETINSLDSKSINESSDNNKNNNNTRTITITKQDGTQIVKEVTMGGRKEINIHNYDKNQWTQYKYKNWSEKGDSKVETTQAKADAFTARQQSISNQTYNVTGTYEYKTSGNKAQKEEDKQGILNFNNKNNVKLTIENDPVNSGKSSEFTWDTKSTVKNNTNNASFKNDSYTFTDNSNGTLSVKQYYEKPADSKYDGRVSIDFEQGNEDAFRKYEADNYKVKKPKK